MDKTRLAEKKFRDNLKRVNKKFRLITVKKQN